MEALANFMYEMFNDDNFIKHMSNFDYTKMNKAMHSIEAFRDQAQFHDKTSIYAKAFFICKRDAPGPDETAPVK
ncbi:uncharacterized protein PHALS_05472 [Plasmopara halstedii]|uniref:Uncharacterized protein n=1 Tax=Plasmopara halstedii TaxID=4781 RepID=A0A0P1AZX0_PLAHL|nr:uncharacterized protein PHALS_05472 [Plasmopara halstedii]CEG47990.1 hypothetical protein PHALS_05472 [Plasmopara halstedii]|eukprot:XP_024584359.1 hypothetical protein PHALS_05472 [Plasmopara halstedii]